MDNFGKTLKMLRNNRNISAVKFSEDLNIHRGSLSNWETGRTVPEWHRLDVVFEAYQLTDEQKLEYIYETIEKAKVRHDEAQAKAKAKKEVKKNNKEEEC